MFDALRLRLAFGVDAATHFRVEGASLRCAFDVRARVAESTDSTSLSALTGCAVPSLRSRNAPRPGRCERTRWLADRGLRRRDRCIDGSSGSSPGWYSQRSRLRLPARQE